MWPSKAMRRAKSDMDRVGLFQEMGYVTVGDPFEKGRGSQERTGRNFVLASYKAKCANQSGYFAPKFLRLSENDPYQTLADVYRKKDREASEKSLAGPLKLGGGEKMECGKGSFCVTINPCPPAMSPLTRTKKKEDFKFAFVTNPPKKGTGSGYVDVTINPYVSSINPEELDSVAIKRDEMEAFKKKMLGGPFRVAFPEGGFFDNSHYVPVPVRQGRVVQPRVKVASHPKPFLVRARSCHDHGNKLGTFHEFPRGGPDPYMTPQGVGCPKVKDVRNKSKVAYFPISGSKSRPVFSTIQVNLDRYLNGNNYRCLDSVIGFRSC